jgi:hypothetical protein
MLDYRPTRRTNVAEVPRRRIVALIAGAAGLGMVLVAGLALSANHVMHRATGTSPGMASSPARGGSSGEDAAIMRARDELAARPMPDVGTGHEFGWPDLSTRDPGPPIQLPPAQGVDGLGVAFGFPQTPQGAMAQLAAIDTAALQSAALPKARAVITAWAAPGGPTARSWSGIRATASLLESAGLPGAGSSSLDVRVTPAMGLIKGQVGNDFVVACIDASVDITYQGHSTTTVVADCQRLLWQDRRWVIGPGAEPAAAPQVWPDTDAAIDAGFRDLT